MEEVTIKESYYLQDNRCLSSLSLFVLSFPKGNEKLFALLSKIVYCLWPNTAREMAAHQVPFCQRQGHHGNQGSQGLVLGWILRNRKRQQRCGGEVATTTIFLNFNFCWFQTEFLQATQAVKFKFEIGKNPVQRSTGGKLRSIISEAKKGHCV